MTCDGLLADEALLDLWAAITLQCFWTCGLPCPLQCFWTCGLPFPFSGCKPRHCNFPDKPLLKRSPSQLPFHQTSSTKLVPVHPFNVPQPPGSEDSSSSSPGHFEGMLAGFLLQRHVSTSKSLNLCWAC